MIHDPTSQTVVLSAPARPATTNNNGVSEAPPSPLVDLQIIKISSIRDVKILASKQDNFKPYEAKPITLAEFKAREELAQKRTLEEERRLGIGVTPEAQKIFDAFARTYFLCLSFADWRLPVTWVGTSIIVAERTLIKPPYTVDNVVSVEAEINGNSAEDTANTHVTRVKHVVDSLRRLADDSCKRSGIDWD